MKVKSIKSIENKKYSTFPFTDIWQQAFGEPLTYGAWLVWGKEKNGKTWFALMLTNYLSQFTKVLYISAEEGVDRDINHATKRAGIDRRNKNIKFSEYVTVDELETYLQKQRAPKVIVVDNLTIYDDELKYGRFRRLLDKYKNTLFIFIAHEENRQPYTGAAKMCRRLAKVIVHVEGLAAHVSGRCPGGTISIHKEKAQLYWGTENE